MSVPKSFQNQVGTIQLSDLDDNFSNLDSRTSNLESKIVNLNTWTVVEEGNTLYFKFNNNIKMILTQSGDLLVDGNTIATKDITSNGEF
jgi:hypothetical protein